MTAGPSRSRAADRVLAVRRAVLATVVAVGLVVGGTLVACAAQGRDAASAPTRSGLAQGKLVPTRGAYLGLYYGDGGVARTNAAIGRSPKVHLSFFGWDEDWGSSSVVAADFRADRIPLVNWEPAADGHPVEFERIVDGSYDPMIRERAQAAKALGRRFFLDFAAEMNEEEGWGDHDPAKYIAAWRHIHDIFTAVGADNAVWVWAPNSTDSDGGAPPATAYYPGSSYVDWVGIDGYNWGSSDADFDWQSFAEVFGPMYDTLVGFRKPMIIAETASDDRGGSKPRWIADIVPTLESRFPQIRAVVWFDIEKERHWRFRSSTASAKAFARFAANDYIVTD